MSRQPAHPKSAAIVRGVVVEEAARHTIRWTSIGVLFLSVAGTIAAFNGAWPRSWRFWEDVSLIAIVVGGGLQALCTVLEWGYRHHRTDPRYFVPLLFDIGGTYAGFAPLLVPVFALAFVRAGLPGSATLIIGHAGVILLSILAAYYPEQTLVSD